MAGKRQTSKSLAEGAAKTVIGDPAIAGKRLVRKKVMDKFQRMVEVGD